MAVELATGYVSLTVSAKGIKGDIEKELGQPVAAAAKNAEQSATKSLQTTGANFTKFGVGALAVAGVVGAGLLKTGESASALGESVNAVQVTFGAAADGILKLGEEAAQSVGLSNVAFNGLAVQFSSFATTIAGEGGNVVATMEEMTTRAADFASVMDLDVAEAAATFQSGLAGETEPLKKFGIDLSAAAVEAYAMANGIGTAGKELTEAEKVQARYGSLMEQTSKTQGDFANTADSAANASRRAKAELENASASVGAAFTPIMAFAASTVASLASKFTSLNDATGGWLAKGAGIAAIAIGAAGAVSLVVGQVTKFKDTLDTVKGAMTNAEGGLSKMGKATKAVGISMGIAAAALAIYSINASQNAQENEELADSINEVSRASDADLMKSYFDVIAKGFITGKDITATMDEFARANLDGAKRVRDYTEAQIAAGTASAAQVNTIDALNAAIAKENAAVAQSAKTHDDAATSTEGLTDATEELIDPAAEAASQLEASKEAAALYQSGIDEMNKGLQESADLLNDQADALHEQASAMRAAADHTYAVQDATDKYNQYLAELDTTIKDAKGDQALINAAYRQGASLAASHADAVVQLAEDTAVANGVTLSASDKLAAWNREMLYSATQAGPAQRAEIMNYIATANGIPAEKVTEIQALIDEGKFAEADALLLELSAAREADVTAEAKTAQAESDLRLVTRPRTVSITPQMAGAIVFPGGYSYKGVYVPNAAEGGIVKTNPGGRLVNVSEGRWDEAIVPLSPDNLKALSGGGAPIIGEVNYNGREFGIAAMNHVLAMARLAS